LSFLARIPTFVLVFIPLLTATFLITSWNTLLVVRFVLGGFGFIRFHTIWIIIFPFALFWSVSSIYLKFKEIKAI
jgi:hypothetical protein